VISNNCLLTPFRCVLNETRCKLIKNSTLKIENKSLGLEDGYDNRITNVINESDIYNYDFYDLMAKGDLLNLIENKKISVNEKIKIINQSPYLNNINERIKCNNLTKGLSF
jgi:hypothetical protein